MKIYLDDERPAPDGWVRCHWPYEVIELLKNNEVTHLSLDHDLGCTASVGSTSSNTGMEVLEWIEKEIGMGHWTKPLPVITIHSANPVAQQRMRLALQNIERFYGNSDHIN